MKKLFSNALIVLMLAAGFMAWSVPGFSSFNRQEVKITYTVHSGDTVWSIAEELQKEVGDPRTIDEIVHYIRKENGLLLDLGFFETPTKEQLERIKYIHPGQRLNITMYR